MARMNLERRTRGDVIRGIGKTWGDFPDGVASAVHEAMARVEGAELVYEDTDANPVKDEGDIVYHINPEGVTCHISLSTAVDIYIYGRTNILNIAARKITNAFGR